MYFGYDAPLHSACSVPLALLCWQVDPTKVTDTANFKDDLSLDSLDAVEVVMAIEDEFTIEIPDSEADKILTVADAINFIITHPAAK